MLIKLLQLLLLTVSINAFAQIDTVQLGEVHLEKSSDTSLSYKERRGQHGALFSIHSEKYYPLDYKSLYNDGFIEDIINTNRIGLIGLELGYKYNFSLFSVAGLFVYAQGGISGSISGTERTIAINKQGLSLNIAADAIFNEPWVVPYFQAGVHQFNIKESKPTESQAASAGFALNYKYGLLIQLDWIESAIDKNAKTERIRSSGMENVYLDIYISQYLASSGALSSTSTSTDGEPNLVSSGEMGVGLKLEF